MKVLGLDLSTHVGYAILDNSKVVVHGTKHLEDIKIEEKAVDYRGKVPDYNLISDAKLIAEWIRLTILSNQVEMVVIEQTNGGGFRTTQKQLEFIHYAVLDMLWSEYQFDDLIVKYIDTSKWRQLVGIKMTKEQLKHNQKCTAGTAKGRVTKKHLAVAWANKTYGLKLLKKDHDAAEAIAMATCGPYLVEKKVETVSVDSALGISK